MNNKEQEEKKSEFNDMFALWQGRGKVAFSTWIKEEIVIPAGAKILAFKVEDANEDNNKPTYRLVWTRD